MLEIQLEKLILMTKESFTNDMYYKFSKVMKNVDKDSMSPQVAYDTILKFYEAEFSSHKIYKDSIENLSDDLKKTIMIYSCYFAMEYIYRQENPLGVDFITCLKNTYPLVDSIDVINEKMRRPKKDLLNIIDFPDPLEINPFYHTSYEIMKGHLAHIYNGELLAFLKSTIWVQNKKMWLRTISPSVIFCALSALGNLPNGGYTNKSNTKITINAIGNISDKLTDYIIRFHNKNSQTISYQAFQESFLAYKPSNDIISKIINLALVDDLFRLNRLHFALECYDSHIKNQKNKGKSGLTKEKQYCYASICSLLTEIPISCFPFHKKVTKEFLNYFTADDMDSYNIKLKQMLFSTSFLFSFTTGLFCTLLFDEYCSTKTENSIISIRKKIDELSEILFEDQIDILNKLEKPKRYIWDDNYGDDENDKVISWKKRNKGNNKELLEGNWKRKDLHKIHISYVNAIMLNQTANRLKKIKYIVEAFWQNDINRKNIFPYKRKSLNPLQYIDEWYPQFWEFVMMYQSNDYKR